jgi:hypothetical protein
MRGMHTTNGNMSGQHRRTKWANRHFKGAPDVSKHFRKLWWADPAKLTSEQLLICLKDYKACEAYYNSQENRDRKERGWWRERRREVEAEMKKREVINE